MKLTAQRKGDPITSGVFTSRNMAAWWRQRMRAHALDWRSWRGTGCSDYEASALHQARNCRDAALRNLSLSQIKHQTPNQTPNQTLNTQTP